MRTWRAAGVLAGAEALRSLVSVGGVRIVARGELGTVVGCCSWRSPAVAVTSAESSFALRGAARLSGFLAFGRRETTGLELVRTRGIRLSN